MEEYDIYGNVMIDADCLTKDFDDYDLNGEIMVDNEIVDSDIQLE